MSLYTIAFKSPFLDPYVADFAPNIGGKNKRKKQDFYVFTRDTTPKSFGTT